VREGGTAALLRSLWSGAQGQVTGDGGSRLHERGIADVHGALVAGWQRLRDGPGPPLPRVRGRQGADGTACGVAPEAVDSLLALADTERDRDDG